MEKIEDISGFIKDSRLRVVVKPNARLTGIISWDDAFATLRIAVAAVPDKDKANVELLKFLKRLTGRKCVIESGSKSRDKLIRFL
jgi:uncharacterized protein (TIGR00251 family)